MIKCLLRELLTDELNYLFNIYTYMYVFVITIFFGASYPSAGILRLLHGLVRSVNPLVRCVHPDSGPSVGLSVGLLTVVQVKFLPAH